MTGQIVSSKLTEMSRNNGVYEIGGLIFQKMMVLAKWDKSTLFNYNKAFPNGVITVIAQGRQLEANGGYMAPNSLQAQSVSNSQYRIYLYSTVQNADMYVEVLAIGY